MVRTKLLIGSQFMLPCVFFVLHSMSQMSRIQMINQPKNKFLVLNFNKLLMQQLQPGIEKVQLPKFII